MPLVGELTSDLNRWLTPDKLRELNTGWRAQGGGHPEAVIDDIANVIVLPHLHYEAVLGYLETQYRRAATTPAHGQHYHGLYAWLVELVYHLLYFRHVDHLKYIENNIRFLEGICRLATQNAPLWVFSLNHDLMVECLAAHCGVPLCCGFSNEKVELPLRKPSGEKTGVLRAEVLQGEQVDRGPMAFLAHGSSGINLLKIHGALDVFTFRDGKDLLRILPAEQSIKGVLSSLRAANEQLIYVDAGGAWKVTNEIAYADDAGEAQFLRRSLLAGAYKYDKRVGQVLPVRLLEHFKSNINYVTRLLCVGYGFGDIHINQVIRDWLEFSTERRIDIVGPSVQAIPAFLLHLAPQVSLKPAAATDYLDAVSGIVRTKRDMVHKRLAGWMRRVDKDTAHRELVEFTRQQQQHSAKALAEKLSAVPMRDGDVDLEALGVTREEFIKRWSDEHCSSAEDVLDLFLRSRTPPA
jgi:hypothetical protein